MRSVLVFGLVLLSGWASAQAEPTPGERTALRWSAYLNRLEGLRGPLLRRECEQIGKAERLGDWLPSHRVDQLCRQMALILDRKQGSDRLAIARLIAQVRDRFLGSVPAYSFCGTGMEMDLGLQMLSRLDDLLDEDKALWARLLNDGDPRVAEAAVNSMSRDSYPNEELTRRLVIWSGAEDPRFRGIAAFYHSRLPLEERILVVGRLLDDPDPDIRHELARTIDGQFAQALFPRVRRGFDRGSSPRKLGIIDIGQRAKDPSLIHEIAKGRLDGDPTVRAAAQSATEYLQGLTKQGN